MRTRPVHKNEHAEKSKSMHPLHLRLVDIDVVLVMLTSRNDRAVLFSSHRASKQGQPLSSMHDLSYQSKGQRSPPEQSSPSK